MLAGYLAYLYQRTSSRPPISVFSIPWWKGITSRRNGIFTPDLTISAFYFELATSRVLESFPSGFHSCSLCVVYRAGSTSGVPFVDPFSIL